VGAETSGLGAELTETDGWSATADGAIGAIGWALGRIQEGVGECSVADATKQGLPENARIAPMVANVVATFRFRIILPRHVPTPIT